MMNMVESSSSDDNFSYESANEIMSYSTIDYDSDYSTDSNRSDTYIGYANGCLMVCWQQIRNFFIMLISILRYIWKHKLDTVLFLLRLVCLYFSMVYCIFLSMSIKQQAFEVVALTNAVISIIRLYQRALPIRGTWEYCYSVIDEHSFHYFIYSFILLKTVPLFVLFIPIILFAILHIISYILSLLFDIGQHFWSGTHFLVSLLGSYATNTLKLVALLEIFIMPMLISFAALGETGPLAPILYFNFMMLRYNTHRNPFSRIVFNELRVTAESLAGHFPTPIKRLVHKGIEFFTMLAPAVPTNVPNAILN